MSHNRSITQFNSGDDLNVVIAAGLRFDKMRLFLIGQNLLYAIKVADIN